MEIELSRLRGKNKSGYQQLQAEDEEQPASSRPGMSTGRAMRSYGGAVKGKGRAKYSDEPEDEIDLLRGDEHHEHYADDEEQAEAGAQQQAKQPPKRPAPTRQSTGKDKSRTVPFRPPDKLQN
ncbi:hypothetical protein FRC18_006730, partial [Serendipita sp. 400]